MTRSVFLLQHSYEDGDGVGGVKVIGIYSTRQLAESAKVRLREQPGFREKFGGFHIDEYLMDEDNWKEGFLLSD